jgi:hypothetical protein
MIAQQSKPSSVTGAMEPARPLRWLSTMVVSLLLVGCTAFSGGSPSIRAAAPSASAAPSRSPAPGPSSSVEPSAASTPVRPTPIPAEPIEATEERDGISVTLALERDRVRAGDPLRFVIRAANAGRGPAAWADGQCNLIASVRIVGPPAPPEPAGRSWSGDAEILKRTTLATDRPAGAALTLEQWERGDRSGGCDSLGGIVDEISVGGQSEFGGVWPGTTSTGAPVPGGPYIATAAFPYLGLSADTPSGGWSPDDIDPITVSVPVTVVPVVRPQVSPGEAMDAVLEDPEFAAWLPSLVRERWDGGDLRYEDGSWVFVLGFDMEAGRAEVRVDASTGIVVDRSLPDIDQT